MSSNVASSAVLVSNEKQENQQQKQFPHPDNTNDNSNPQQGTGNSGNSVGSSSIATEETGEKRFEQAPKEVSVSVVDSAPNRVPSTRRDARKLFVGGLPPDITEDEFHMFFSQFGTIVDSVVMFDRETRRSRGFGFVTYQDPEVAKSLLQMKNGDPPMPGRLFMRGKLCEVKAAEPKESTNSNGPRIPKGSPHHHHQRAVDRGLAMDPHAAYAYGAPVLPPHVPMYQEHQQHLYAPPQMMYNQSYAYFQPNPPVPATGAYPLMYYPSPAPAGMGAVAQGIPFAADMMMNPALVQPSFYGMPSYDPSQMAAPPAPVFAVPAPAPNHMIVMGGTSSAMHPVAPGIPPAEPPMVVVPQDHAVSMTGGNGTESK